MATQTFVTHSDMQALGGQAAAAAGGVQVQQTSSQAAAVTGKTTSSVPQTAILQSAQSGGQQFIVTIGDPNGENQLQQVQEVHVPTAAGAGAGTQQIIYQQNSQYVQVSSPDTSATSATDAALYSAAATATPPNGGGLITVLKPQTSTTTQARNVLVGTRYVSKSDSSEFTGQIGQPAVEIGQQFVQVNQPNTRQKKYVYNATANAGAGEARQYDYTQSTMYTPVSGTYYTQGPGGPQMTSGITQLGVQGQLLTHGGGTYLVQGGAMDADGTPLAHTTRASPATDPNDPRNSHFDVKSWQREVQWLIDNYETAEGVSLPRSTLYNHYLRHCQEQKIDPMNPASFGKLIRSVFLGLRTRRLGTRGNSKYHYYGIRIKATSPLNQFTDDTTMAMRQQPMNPNNKRFKTPVAAGTSGEGQDGSGGENSQQHQHQQFLGDASGAIPNFDAVEVDKDLPEGITQEDIDIFEHLYQQHCEGILDIVVNLQFALIEDLWQSFWRVKVKQEMQQNGGHEEESRLSKEKLYTISRYPPVHKFVRKSDYAFYQALVEVLIPDVLRPIPSSLTQAIRNFAKSLEGWLKTAMVGVPEEMTKAKLGSVGAFAQTLRRYTSLNHLAQAARAVLQNTTQINQMLADLNRVDFANVQEQASWVCQCEDGVVHQLEQDFKKTLQGQNSLEQWAMWLESVVNKVLQPHEGSHNFPKAARQFLLKWSFYSSMVIRDLTLRSAASFGSFHLIRLLYDEYMFYLVEHKVAAATGETPIAVMGEVKQLIDLGNVMALGNLDSIGTDTSKPSSSNNAVAQQKTITVVTAAAGSNKMTKPLGTTITTLSRAGGSNHVTTAGATTLAQLTTVSNPSAASGGGTKTIVVVPMSAATAANPGSGDHVTAQIAKKMKLAN